MFKITESVASWTSELNQFLPAERIIS